VMFVDLNWRLEGHYKKDDGRNSEKDSGNPGTGMLYPYPRCKHCQPQSDKA
jgi:hypothetical protein